MHKVPPVVRAKAETARATAWLAQLPVLIQRLERDWSIRVGAAFGDATEAFVAPAVQRDGTPAVLKLVVPRDEDAAAREITALRLCSGEGCVTLLRVDVDKGALLLERLGPSLHDLGLPLAARHEILCATAERVWRSAPHAGLPTGRDKARWLTGLDAAAIWEWGVVERVPTGLLGTKVGLQPVAAEMLAAADAVAGLGAGS